MPFVVGYVTIAQLDPQGVLLGFGLLALATGYYFRTPMSVQPMKAIARAAVTQPQLVTRTGGALVIFGTLLVFFGGIELAVGLDEDTFARSERTVQVVTAGIALWNMGVACLAGLLLYHAAHREILRR